MSIHFDEFELDVGRRQLLRSGHEVHLSPKAFLLLQLLIDRRPNAVSKTEIYDQLWPSTFVSDVNVPSVIAEVRTALEDDAHNPRFIRTVHGFGYAFCAEPLLSPSVQETFVATLSVAARELRLTTGETVIGRDLALPCCIDDPTVSRHHAAIFCTPETATIRDLDSKNGTFVGGLRITGATELRDGDVILIGSVDAKFRRPGSTSTVTISPEARRKPTQS